VLLHHLLHLLLLNELSLVLFHVQDNLRPSLQFRVIARPDCEGSSSGGLPNVLLVIVVLGGHDHLVCDEVGGVEADTKLTDHGNISSRRESLHEGLGA